MIRLSYRYLLPVSIGWFILAGCQKNFLDRYPQSTISDAQFWNTPNDLQLFCNNFYQYLPSYTGYNNLGIYSMDDISDNGAPVIYSGRLNGETIVPATGGGWATTDWQPILSTNYFLANYGKVLTKSSWADVKVSVGEALFFRACFYYDKLRSFGDLPWINKVLSTNDSLLYYTRLPRNVIVDSMVKDLDSAVSYLSPKAGLTDPMRVSKELALGFKARVCLYEGTWEKYHQNDAFGAAGQTGAVFLQQAADAAQAVITAGTRTLDNVGVTNGYWSLFNLQSYAASKEVIFWRSYSQALGVVNDWPRYSASGAARGITKSLVDDYLCSDGLPIAVSPLYAGDDSLATLIRHRDPRLSQTIYTKGAIITSNKPNGALPDTFYKPTLDASGETQSITGYEIYKGHTTDYTQQVPQQGTQGLIFMRYAEVLLILAEAKTELGTITQADIDASINLLRARVGMPSLIIGTIAADPNWLYPALSPLLNEVRRERRIELAVEGFRLDDIFRWAAADKLIVGARPLGAKWNQWATLFSDLTVGSNIYVNAQGYIDPYQKTTNLATGFKFNINRDYLLPLPQNELTLNKNIKQNPGW